jgi:hypothetical protein
MSLYLLIRTGGASLLKLEGELIEGFICRKAGGMFRRKWLPIFSEGQLSAAGLLERARSLLAAEDQASLFADGQIMGCAYKPGPCPDGTVVKLDEIAGLWLRNSSLGPKSTYIASVSPTAFTIKVGSFLEHAERLLHRSGETEISAEGFRDAMVHAAEYVGFAR